MRRNETGYAIEWVEAIAKLPKTLIACQGGLLDVFGNSFAASRRIPAYAASKGDVMQLTKALSNEWAGKGINVNPIAPGYMEMALAKDLIDTEHGRNHTARIPAGRWGKPEDLEGAVVFMASTASDYISGAILAADGGYLGA